MSVAEKPLGVYNVSYAEDRKTKRALRYRLRRRTDEVESAIRRFGRAGDKRILDVGTADAAMLDLLYGRLGASVCCYGMDFSLALLQSNRESCALKIRGDAQAIPLLHGSIDVLVATAIIEHIDNVNAMMEEVLRVLKPSGIVVMSTPNPLMAAISEKLGLLKDSEHQQMFTLKGLCQLLLDSGFIVLLAKRFMFSPVGFPGEKTIERFLGPLGLRLIMANQLVVAKKRD